MISVIIPTFNRAYILKKSLPTYFSELVSEIIIVDDGSTDNTKDVVKELSKDFIVKYVKHDKRLGLPQARNTGIKFVSEKSKYVFFGEDDVVLAKNCYQITIEVLEKNFLDLVAINVKYLSSNEDFTKYLSDDIKVLYPKSFEDILRFKSIHLAKKYVYNSLNFDEKYIYSAYREETDFYLRASKKYKIALIENYFAFNLPRDICNTGGEWSFNPVVYEFSAIYNNLRFLFKNRKIIGINYFDLFKRQLSFTIERLRALKSKLLK